ncbi:hypothetical protein FOCC_FOCC014775, partial [Frankliniella occidentalis]
MLFSRSEVPRALCSCFFYLGFHSTAMNVIRQPRGNPSGGPSRPLMGPQKSRGRGRGALDFNPIQFRPGQRASSSTDSGDSRTPSNWQLQMAISSSAYRTSSSSIRTASGNAYTPSPHPNSRQSLGKQCPKRSRTLTSSSSITPTSSSMPPPKTPRCNTSTPNNGSFIVSSTPRTTPSSSSGTDNQHSHVVLALTEGRGHARGEVGMAVIDIKRPRLILCQLSDRQTYANTLTKISVFRPLEILIPNTFVDSSQPNKLYSLLEEKFPFTNMTKVQRRLFRDSDGLEKVQNLCLPENSSCQLVVQDRFYALAAAAALLKYVEYVQNVIFAAHSLKVEYQGAHDGTLIDVKTAKNLELLLNQQSNTVTHTLVGIMDHCCTHGGSRLLRASLLHPPCSLPIITSRQDGVQEMLENSEMAQKIREILKEMPDVEQLLTLCMLTPSTVGGTQCMEKRINYVLMLKTTLEILPLLGAALENSQSTLLGKAKECLKDSRGDVMKARILETLHEDVKAPKGGKAALFQKCFAVKSGVNDLLDVARKTYSELINDIHDHVSSMGTTHSLPLKIDYSVTKGYHIQITFQKNHRIEKSTLPPFFVQVQQSRNCLTCTTDTLIHANERIKHVTSDILSISHRLLTTVLNDIRQHISYLYEMCESIAVIDLVLALAHTASCNNYVRPTFGDELSLKLSRHPILESFSTCDPVANDIKASSWKNLCIITGANMSGKSIYLRQVLLLQIMAQVGSFVPAEQAVFRLTDHIFSHLNFDDSIENNASTLSLEMQEMQFILSNITPTSIVALDELCRGTSVEEGTAIAWSLCEELNQSTMTKVQRRLFRDSDGLEKVQNLCLPENSSCQLVVQDRFYALAAAAALLKYVEYVQNVIFAAHSLKVEYQGAHDGTLIDVKTAKNLELLLNQQSNTVTHTLVGIMDHCCTHGGSRLLRASLLHPPCSLPIITSRQDGVQEMLENSEMAQKIREILKEMPDVEQLLTLCMLTPSTVGGTQCMEKRINYVLMLKTTLEILPLLGAALENSQSTLLGKAKECLKDSRGDVMKARILETLHEDVKAPKGGKAALFQKCFAVKSGVNDLLDVARKTYSELINDIHDHVS